MKKLCIMLVGLFILTGCTVIQNKKEESASVKQGYSQVRLSDKRYHVTYTGNVDIPAKKVYQLYLKRCAELTLSKGYRYFVIQTQDKAHVFVPVNTTDIAVDQKGGITSQLTSNQYTSEGTIDMFAAGKQPTSAIDAQSILKSLK